MRSLSGQQQQRKQLLCQIVGSYLETSTQWGKFRARPSQIRAAAKRMVDAGRIPKPVADASGVDAYNGVTTGRGHLTGQRHSVQANIQQVLAEKEVTAAIAATTNGSGHSGCDS